MTTPDNITQLKPNEVFVFGSNLLGRHGAGAALTAYERFGAVKGRGFGIQGQSFAIPTKNEYLQPLPVERIRTYVNSFYLFAKGATEKHFLITKIGCGYAGYTPAVIAPLFREVALLPNVSLPKEFVEVLKNTPKMHLYTFDDVYSIIKKAHFSITLSFSTGSPAIAVIHKLFDLYPAFAKECNHFIPDVQLNELRKAFWEAQVRVDLRCHLVNPTTGIETTVPIEEYILDPLGNVSSTPDPADSEHLIS